MCCQIVQVVNLQSSRGENLLYFFIVFLPGQISGGFSLCIRNVSVCVPVQKGNTQPPAIGLHRHMEGRLPLTSGLVYQAVLLHQGQCGGLMTIFDSCNEQRIPFLIHRENIRPFFYVHLRQGTGKSGICALKHHLQRSPALGISGVDIPCEQPGNIFSLGHGFAAAFNDKGYIVYARPGQVMERISALVVTPGGIRPPVQEEPDHLLVPPAADGHQRRKTPAAACAWHVHVHPPVQGHNRLLIKTAHHQKVEEGHTGTVHFFRQRFHRACGHALCHPLLLLLLKPVVSVHGIVRIFFPPGNDLLPAAHIGAPQQLRHLLHVHFPYLLTPRVSRSHRVITMPSPARTISGNSSLCPGHIQRFISLSWTYPTIYLSPGHIQRFISPGHIRQFISPLQP